MDRYRDQLKLLSDAELSAALIGALCVLSIRVGEAYHDPAVRAAQSDCIGQAYQQMNLLYQEQTRRLDSQPDLTIPPPLFGN